VIFSKTELLGAWMIEPERLTDERGFFARLFDSRAFSARGLATVFPQISVSYNMLAGTLRGMHFQADPHQEAKLIRCTAGAVYDVIIDLRGDSATFGRWTAVDLTAENRRTLYVPPGLAHGFQTRTDSAELLYHISAPYEPFSARGVRWNDPFFQISWPAEPRVISDKDCAYPDFLP
jgi:dTDP-4-dehydrorhamnose 3,5-epimerase